MIATVNAGIIAGDAGACWFAATQSQGLGADLRHAVFQRVQNLSFSDLDWEDPHHPGQLQHSQGWDCPSRRVAVEWRHIAEWKIDKKIDATAATAGGLVTLDSRGTLGERKGDLFADRPQEEPHVPVVAILPTPDGRRICICR